MNNVEWFRILVYKKSVNATRKWLSVQTILKHNQVVYETCALLHLNEDEDEMDEGHDIFSTEDKDGPFFDFLYVSLGVIAAILVVGTIYEIARRNCFAKRAEDDAVVASCA